MARPVTIGAGLRMRRLDDLNAAWWCSPLSDAYVRECSLATSRLHSGPARNTEKNVTSGAWLSQFGVVPIAMQRGSKSSRGLNRCPHGHPFAAGEGGDRAASRRELDPSGPERRAQTPDADDLRGEGVHVDEQDIVRKQHDTL